MKKLLIITYYWPPAGGIGVQRWLQFSKELVKLGYQVHVYTPENPSYPVIDESLISEVPKEVQVVKKKIWEPYRIAEFFNPKNKEYKQGKFNTKNPSLLSQLSLFIRGNYFIPDARKFWVKPSVRFLDQYLKENAIDTVITTGPPHSTHLIGEELKSQNPELQWIADFRDPWTQISYHEDLKLSPWAKKKHKELEKRVLSSADTVLAASFTDAEEYKKLGAQNSISLINGFQEELPSKEKKNSQFTLSYIGKLEQQRNPEVLWNVLQELSEENEEFRNDLKIQLIGNIDTAIIKELQSSPLTENLEITEHVEHEKAKEYMVQSDLLLLTNFNDEKSKGIIPAKLFEYMATKNPILSIGPKDADVSVILDDVGIGQHFEYKDQGKIKDFIVKQFSAWKKNENSLHSFDINKYSRHILAEKLNKIILDYEN